MTAPADIDTALSHILLFEVFTEPLVVMTGSRDQVMEGNKMVAAAKRTGLAHYSTPGESYLAVQWRCIS